MNFYNHLKKIFSGTDFRVSRFVLAPGENLAQTQVVFSLLYVESGQIEIFPESTAEDGVLFIADGKFVVMPACRFFTTNSYGNQPACFYNIFAMPFLDQNASTFISKASIDDVIERFKMNFPSAMRLDFNNSMQDAQR